MPSSRRKPFIFTDHANGIESIIWHFPLMEVGDDMFTEVMDLLRTIGVSSETWQWLERKEAWLASQCDLFDLPEHTG